MRRAKETSREARSQQRAWDWRAKDCPAIWRRVIGRSQFPAIWLRVFRFLAHHGGSISDFQTVLQEVVATSRPMRGQRAANPRRARVCQKSSGARFWASRRPRSTPGHARAV